MVKYMAYKKEKKYTQCFPKHMFETQLQKLKI